MSGCRLEMERPNNALGGGGSVGGRSGVVSDLEEMGFQLTFK